MAQAHAEWDEKRFFLDGVSARVREDLRKVGVAEVDAVREGTGVQQSLSFFSKISSKARDLYILKILPSRALVHPGFFKLIGDPSPAKATGSGFQKSSLDEKQGG